MAAINLVASRRSAALTTSLTISPFVATPRKRKVFSGGALEREMVRSSPLLLWGECFARD